MTKSNICCRFLNERNSRSQNTSKKSTAEALERGLKCAQKLTLKHKNDVIYTFFLLSLLLNN